MIKLIHTKRFWCKFIRVTGQTSYQSHHNRNELHIGIAKVAKEQKHRLNPGWYIEFAWGKPEEDDIIRYEDNYGRN